MREAIQFLIGELAFLYALLIAVGFQARLTDTAMLPEIRSIHSKLCLKVLIPLTKLIPLKGRWDLASLVAIYLVQLAVILVMQVLFGSSSHLPHSLWQALIGGIGVILTLYKVLIIVWVVMSWLRPQHPLGGHCYQLLRPIIQPIQNKIGRLGGIDFSPLIAFLILQFISIAISA